MGAVGRKAEESARTRGAILDATEALMREDGYAAVTTRRLAETAGVNLGLIHYHFGGLDEVFLALFQRVDDQHLGRIDAALEAEDPLRALWAAHSDAAATALISEFMALANHRKAIREEIARSCERIRGRQAAILGRILPELGLEPDRWPPLALSLLMAGASRALAAETAIGVHTGHAETFDFIERRLAELKARRPAET